MQEGSIGRANFAERHGLWSDIRREAAERAEKIAREKGITQVRLSFCDQHGLLRGKSVMAEGLGQALRNGCSMTTTLLLKDSSHRTVYPVWQKGGGFGKAELTGAGDFIMVPDPTTFRVLPWTPHTGWMLCDIFFPNGEPVPFSTRDIGRRAMARLADAGYDFVTGLEIELHLFRLEDPKLRPEQSGQPAEPPEVSLAMRGFQYLTETRMDEIESILELLRGNLMDLGLPLRTMEVEFGPTQVELTLHPGSGLETADGVVLLRAAVKQICRRQGYHATFMCRPALPTLFSSGWHLHMSLVDRKTGRNALMPDTEAEPLSAVGRRFVAGLLEHARSSCVFTTPTINGYKRYRSYSLAPDRVLWGRDNRGAMLRTLGGAGDPGTRIENRIGDPAANPYLYLASQIHCGLDGMARDVEPTTPADMPYDTEAPRLPASLMEAVAALRDDAMYRDQMGSLFVDYILTIKQFEISRFLSEVTDWEQREYFEMF